MFWIDFKKLVLSLLAGVVWAIPVFGQFEGKIVFEHRDAGNASGDNDDVITMFITPERILLQGQNSYNILGNIKSEGILVRLDHEDFVFLTGKDEVLRISKDDITSLMNFFTDGDTDEPVNPGLEIEKLNETREIVGYSCTKFKFVDTDDPDDYVIAWMTTDIPINWGMLGESWSETSAGLLGSDLPFDTIFKEGNFPVRIEAYKNGTLEEITEAVEISESGIARAMVQIPPGVKVLSFQDYLFQKMSQQ